MAAPQENLLSLGHLTGTERNTFTKQTQHGLKKSVNRPLLLQTDFSTHQHLRAMHLQRRWQELKERELAAQQHNKQLLQQFGEAQDTLREMLTLTATMKTIRMEYERYLEESTPRWQQQLREKTKAAQRKQFTRMDEYLRSYLKNADERATKSSADQPSHSQGLTAKPQKHYSQNSCYYNQDGSLHVPFMQPPWQTHPQPQTARFPFTVPYQPQGSSHVPTSYLPPPIIPPPPHLLQLHPLASTLGQHHPWSRQNPPSWASPQADCLRSWTGGAVGIPSGSEALWGQLGREEPPLEEQVVGEEPDTSTAPSSRRERGVGSRSSRLSQELDIKPVRLSSWPAENGESSRESSQASTERRKKKKKKGRSRRTSSDRDRCSSQESSSSAIITAVVTVAGGSENDASLEKSRTSTSRRMRRSRGLQAGSPRAEKVVKERTGSEEEDSGSHKDESQSEELGSPAEGSRSEKPGDQSPDDESESCREESGSVSIKIENRAGDETERQERSSSDGSSAGEKDEEEEKLVEDLGDGGGEKEGDAEEKEDSQSEGEQHERDVEEDDDDDVSERKTSTEEEGTGAEEESEENGNQEKKSDGMMNEDVQDKQGSSSSQDEEEDEDESEGGQDKMEKDGESEEEEDVAVEEKKESDKAGEPEEESDSDVSIILPQNKSKKIQVIPEEASEAEDGDDDEEEKGSKTGSSDNSDELSDEDDVEHLLAPQVQPQKKEEKELRADEKQKALCDKVEIFQVEKSAKSDHASDSDEFDHFYD